MGVGERKNNLQMLSTKRVSLSKIFATKSPLLPVISSTGSTFWTSEVWAVSAEVAQKVMWESADAAGGHSRHKHTVCVKTMSWKRIALILRSVKMLHLDYLFLPLRINLFLSPK